MRRFRLILVLLALSVARPVAACTAFCFAGEKRVVAGKSYDWFFGHGHGALYVNPRGIARTSIVLGDTFGPARWTSRFGSVTLTQFGRGMPVSGMNERGLVIELLQAPEADWTPGVADNPFVNESQWAQFNLDRHGSVDEVIAAVESLRIERAFTGIHYFVADASGASATISFEKGRPVVHAGAGLPVPVLTNTYYRDALKYAKDHPEFPPEQMSKRSSEVRFVRARAFTDVVPITPDAELGAMAWRTLDAVRVNGTAPGTWLAPSQWNIVHDLTARAISFRTRAAAGIKRVTLGDLNLSEGAPELMVGMNDDFTGDVRDHLRPYTPAENERLLRKNELLFKLALRGEMVEHAVAYGQTCDTLLTPPKHL